MDDRDDSKDVYRRELQTRRLVQLEAMPPEVLGMLIEQMRVGARLPRLEMHFRQHGAGFEATSAKDYERRFQEHVTSNEPQRFTFIRPETDDIRWHLLEPATGAVAVYNETQMRYWSFFQNHNVSKFQRGFRGYWVEVRQDDDDWQFKPWSDFRKSILSIITGATSAS